MIAVEVHGQRKDGRAVTGVTLIDSAAAYVQRRYDEGWRWLTLTPRGRRWLIIGRIEIRDHRRTWWAES